MIVEFSPYFQKPFYKYGLLGVLHEEVGLSRDLETVDARRGLFKVRIFIRPITIVLHGVWVSTSSNGWGKSPALIGLTQTGHWCTLPQKACRLFSMHYIDLVGCRL